MTHGEFLDKFGPARNASEAFGVSTICIGHWKKRGIPSFYWTKALELAVQNDWPLTLSELVENSPSKRVQAHQLHEIAKNGQI